MQARRGRRIRRKRRKRRRRRCRKGKGIVVFSFPSLVRSFYDSLSVLSGEKIPCLSMFPTLTMKIVIFDRLPEDGHVSQHSGLEQTL